MFVSLLRRQRDIQTGRIKMIYFVHGLTVKKIVWLDSKAVQSLLIKRGFKRNYTVWTKHGEIDDTLHEVDTGVGDNNYDGVFHVENPDAAADDDFDYQELLHHVEPQVLSSMGTR
jgi:hypothetical protein